MIARPSRSGNTFEAVVYPAQGCVDAMVICKDGNDPKQRIYRAGIVGYTILRVKSVDQTILASFHAALQFLASTMLTRIVSRINTLASQQCSIPDTKENLYEDNSVILFNVLYQIF